jgi:hypothetical protein
MPLIARNKANNLPASTKAAKCTTASVGCYVAASHAWAKPLSARIARNFPNYNSILRPISTSEFDGILKRSMACAELRDMKENKVTRHRASRLRCWRLIGS